MPMSVHAPPPPVTLAIAGTEARFAVRRIYCIGRNYVEHVREMGGEPALTPPVYFCKPIDAVLADGADFPYPPMSRNVQPEVELVVAIGRGGDRIPRETALEHVFGYAVGNDWTRRDLQGQAKRAGEPWDLGKGFDHSAAVGPIHPVAQVGHPCRGAIRLAVNGEVRQCGDLAEMIRGVADIIADLSAYVRLAPGDLLYTGTPAGVAPVLPGDHVECSIEGLGRLVNQVVESR